MSDKSNVASSTRTRRTLQSGFSLMSRGEPKIWITGGMLVICLTMVVGLMSLIVVNGMATFWPRPIDWLVLSNNQMDIGEWKSSEVKTAGSETSESSTANQPSYFYRTANFDITSRHYRWFAPDELQPWGIVRPEWALLVERMSWGRMIGVPARLAIAIDLDRSHEKLQSLEAADALLKDLISDPDIALTAVENEGEAKQPTLDDYSTALAELYAVERSTQLRTLSDPLSAVSSNAISSTDSSSVASRSTGPSVSSLQYQATEGEAWQTTMPEKLWAVRRVWDEPQAMLEQIEPLLSALHENREQIATKMHEISQLDERLARARIAVRRAELDTQRIVLNKVEDAGVLIDAVVHRERMDQRVARAIETASTVFPEGTLRENWRKLLETYRRDTLQPALVTARAAVDEWAAQFSPEPPAIVAAVKAYSDTYKLVAEKKLPLENDIRTIQQRSTADEFMMMVPTDALALELAPADARLLKSGRRNAAIDAALATHAIVTEQAELSTVHFNDQISVTQLHDSNRGRVDVWCIERPMETTDGTKPADGAEKTTVCMLPSQRVIPCDEIVRLFPANRLTLAGKLQVYAARWSEFLLDDPREANTEGGVFPAIWGTIVMTLIMTLAVVPFGVIAALYLREYTRSGPIVSMVRISINNLAGVPSIVYGVFGLAFFCYSIGAFIDGGAKNADFGRLPTGTWYAWLAATVVCGVVSFMISLLSSGPEHTRTDWMRVLARVAPLLWLTSLVGVGVLIFKSPFFDGFYEARLPAPTFGKEGLLWASLTLALLTLPVVIVATEEALSAVPNSLREGSLACGASKWQTIYRIVLPHARPGILTGAILAMARGIGEVAPLMLVGALPVAPDLPLDSEFPYFHGSRSFMHLGYQIYWLGFQSQNSEASKPLVFTCTLLLILIVVSLNLSAILLRARLRRRFQGNQF